MSGSLSWLSSPSNYNNDYNGWYVPVQNMTISQQLVFTSANGSASAEFINGYSYIGLTTDIWTGVCSVIQQYNMNFTTNQTNVTCDSTTSMSLIYGNGACSSFSSDWNFAMQFANSDSVFTMSARNFSLDTTNNSGLPQCVWNF